MRTARVQVFFMDQFSPCLILTTVPFARKQPWKNPTSW